MKILIFGAGSIGIFLGTKLYNAGYDVTLYGRRKLSKIHDTILIDGKLFKTPPRIYKIKPKEEYDIIFVTTKLYDSKKAINEIKRFGLESKILAFIQNGLVGEGFYKNLDKRPGFVTISIFEGYRLIENQLLTTKSKLGWQTEDSDTGREVCNYLNNAKINCSSSSKLSLLRAEKMIMVNALGALSAIERKTLGELVKNARTRNIAEQILKETYDVLKNYYALSNFEEFKKRYYQTINAIKTHYSSMYQDVVSDRKTEIDFLNGLIVELGRKKKIATPINKAIRDKIRGLNTKK